MKHKEVEQYLLSLNDTRLDYPFGPEAAVYKVKVNGDEKMFAIIAEGSDPVRISLKCDPQLAEVLREKYVSVMPGYHLNKKHWNTIVLSGEIEWEEIQGFIRLSYDLVTKKK
jgi:predicted DNA-binding protein (MmcQ/YjbR family)